MSNPADTSVAPQPIATLRGSGLRLVVSFGSLAGGQLLLGEKDVDTVVRRAAVGAILAEGAAQFIQFAQSEGNLNRPLDPLLLASYGERELQKFCALVQTALLHSRTDGRCP